MKILYTATVLSHICQFHLPHMQHLQEQGWEVHVAAHDNLAVKNGLQLKYDKASIYPVENPHACAEAILRSAAFGRKPSNSSDIIGQYSIDNWCGAVMQIYDRMK